MLSQSGGHTSPTWALLDNKSTVDVFSIMQLLKNIRIFYRELEIFSMGDRRPKLPRGILLAMEWLGSTQEAYPIYSPSHKWHRNTAWSMTALV